MIAEKAVGVVGRRIALTFITITLYGTSCVYICLMGDFLHSLAKQAGFEFDICYWMMIIAVAMIPVSWLGTPNDFWPVAIGALLTTVGSSVLIMVKEGTSVQDKTSCYYYYDNGTYFDWEPNFPEPTVEGVFKAFSSILFAYAGASTFPTIQADMRDRRKFPISIIFSMLILVCIYMPMASVGYFLLGDTVQNNIVESLCDGPIKITVEALLLIHLISVFPIMLNPPNQFFEELLHIPKNFNIWRCLYRTGVVLFLLFISESLPNFGAILDLIGGSTITFLTFVFPPFFYMRLSDMSSSNLSWEQRKLPTYERVFCWFTIVLGLAGGSCATYNAVNNIISSSDFTPCYLKHI